MVTYSTSSHSMKIVPAQLMRALSALAGYPAAVSASFSSPPKAAALAVRSSAVRPAASYDVTLPSPTLTTASEPGSADCTS